MDRLNENCLPILTAKQMRMADRHTIEHEGVSAEMLMERAGQAVVDGVTRSWSNGGRVVVIVGAGNNGGDGLVAARLLRNRRIPVTAIPIVPVEKLKGDIGRQAELARQAGVKIRPAICPDDLHNLEYWLKRASIVIDAVFGTGLDRPLEGWVAEVVETVNRSDRTVLSVDIPSGVDADHGEIFGTAVEASFTLPIAAYKWGHWLNGGACCSGQLLAPAPIGISEQTLATAMATYPCKAPASYLMTTSLVKAALPERSRDAHKGDFGHLWIFGGSEGYTGAPRLAASGAQAVRTGLVSIACPEHVYPVVAVASLEVMVHSQEKAPWQQASVVVAGPGWGKEQGTQLAALLKSELPLLLDADALNMLAENERLEKTLSNRSALSVITPHPGEAGRLMGWSSKQVQEKRFDVVLALAERFKSWVVLKGAQTLVASPDGTVWLSPFGSSNLAVAGSGDVLSGMIGGLLSAGVAPELAVPGAVGLHAIAGEQDGWHRAGELEDVIVGCVSDFREPSTQER